MIFGSVVDAVNVWVGVGMLKHAQPLEMMLEAKAERAEGIIGVPAGLVDVDDVVVILRLLSTSLSTGFGIRCPEASPRF